MAEAAKSGEAPQTLEGWYVLHDVYRLDWPRLGALEAGERQRLAAEASEWLAGESAQEKGDSALYSVLSQKGDLLLLHYRPDPEQLSRVELGLRRIRLYELLEPCYSYLSVIEVSLYEVSAMAMRRLARRGIVQGSEGFDAAFEQEMALRKEKMNERLFRAIPAHRYLCFYPMSKRRGEQVNWYTLALAERRAMMRRHGAIGHKYSEQIVQVIGGSMGLDDWEWGVSLHSNDMLAFKKLVYEMRFDPASALFAEFGPFYLGIRRQAQEIPALLSGRLDLLAKSG